MSCFWMSPPLYTILLYHDIYIFTMISCFLFHYIIYMLAFVLVAAFIHVFIFLVYDQDIFAYDPVFFLWKLLWSAFFCFLFTNREYNSGNFYTTPYFCLRIVNNLQNTKCTKYKIFRRLQNTKYKIYFLYWQNFVFGTLQKSFI